MNFPEAIFIPEVSGCSSAFVFFQVCKTDALVTKFIDDPNEIGSFFFSASVVHNEAFPVCVTLSNDALKRPLDGVAPIEKWDDYADGNTVCHWTSVSNLWIQSAGVICKPRRWLFQTWRRDHEPRAS